MSDNAFDEFYEQLYMRWRDKYERKYGDNYYGRTVPDKILNAAWMKFKERIIQNLVDGNIEE